MEQKAKVITGGDIAMIEVIRNSSCGENCATCGGCSDRNRRLITKARNLAGAREGNIVWVETSDRDILKKAFILYILPLFAFFAGYLIPDSYHLNALYCGLIGLLSFIGCFFAVYLYDKKLRKKGELPNITRIIQ